jgi:uncharacterized protein (DUF427 family)
MQLFKVFTKVTWKGTLLFNSYYLVRAENKQQARQKAKDLAWIENAPSNQARISIRTSFKNFIQ